MRLHRFFIEEPLQQKEKITLEEKNILHQLKHVFRLEAGDSLILLDNSGKEFLTQIHVLSKEKGEFTILESKEVENIPKKELWLFASLIKKDHYEWILEKCTELGVSHFVPILSERTEKKDVHRERARKIIQEASEQSERGMLPGLHDIMSLNDALTFGIAQNMPLVAFHMLGERFQQEKHILESKIGLFIGPEGGWSDKELAVFKEKNIPLYSVGKQVLRAETAAVAISSLLLLQ